MIYKNYRLGSNWNLSLILSLVFLSFCFYSCTVKSVATPTYIAIPENAAPADSIVYIKIVEMPAFQDEGIVVGYPIESKGFPKKRYDLEDTTTVRYPFRLTEFPVKEYELDNRTVVGYPVKTKGFPKSGTVSF